MLAWGAPLTEEPKRRPTETSTAEGESERGRKVSCSGGLYKDSRILKRAELGNIYEITYATCVVFG